MEIDELLDSLTVIDKKVVPKSRTAGGRGRQEAKSFRYSFEFSLAEVKLNQRVIERQIVCKIRYAGHNVKELNGRLN